MKKTAVILLNLGGPSSLKEVKNFLFRLFYDKAIIRLPNPLRWMVAKLISNLREKTAKEIYAQMGGSSPILSETLEQKKALAEKLGDKNYSIFISMRYSEPFGLDAARKVMENNPDEVILLPLYPQFSTTTSASSIDDMKKSLSNVGYEGKIKTVGCYPTNENFIKSHVSLIKNTLKNLKSKEYRILFSAHSLPEKIINDGDPYQWQIEKSVEKIVESLKIKDLDYKITYQSKVTPVKWLEPNTETEIKNSVAENKALVVVPIAFVSEHSETLVELDIEYKEIADENSVEYHRVPALTSDKNYIAALADIVKSFSKSKKSLVTSDKFSRICPNNFDKCICRNE